ncbi:hypothetical protein NMG60_11012308 [Bertholletia excelsa]
MAGHGSPESSNLSISTAGKGQPKSSATGEVNNRHINGKKEKRIIHREIERQRRQEMANLYTSLRSLLPLEYIKGKRSVSDHVHGAVIYIKQLQKTIKEMEIKRDKLKKLSSSSSVMFSARESSYNCATSRVTVKSCWGGVEILITSGFKDENFPLSKVLGLLVDEGLDAFSCISTEADGRLLLTIKSEVSVGRSLDQSELQQKLSSAITLEPNSQSN